MSGHQKHTRGASLHRVEGFSDAVFAFAVTLLVVSLEVPKSVHELFHLMQGFVAFGIAFLLLMIVWFEHNRFFRRYAITDNPIMALNMLLLFLVLLYVYPLKFLFSALADNLLWGATLDGASTPADVRKLMVLYGCGMVALNAVFALMHAHVWRLRASLELSLVEQIELKGALRANLVNMLVPLISIVIALLTVSSFAWSGFSYFLLAPLQSANGFYTGRERRRCAGV